MINKFLLLRFLSTIYYCWNAKIVTILIWDSYLWIENGFVIILIEKRGKYCHVLQDSLSITIAIAQKQEIEAFFQGWLAILDKITLQLQIVLRKNSWKKLRFHFSSHSISVDEHFGRFWGNKSSFLKAIEKTALRNSFENRDLWDV